MSKMRAEAQMEDPMKMLFDVTDIVAKAVRIMVKYIVVLIMMMILAVLNAILKVLEFREKRKKERDDWF